MSSESGFEELRKWREQYTMDVDFRERKRLLERIGFSPRRALAAALLLDRLGKEDFTAAEIRLLQEMLVELRYPTLTEWSELASQHGEKREG